MCLFPSRASQEIRGTIQSPPLNNSKLQDSWRWRKFPRPKLSASILSPAKPPPPSPLCSGSDAVILHMNPPVNTRSDLWLNFGSPGTLVNPWSGRFDAMLWAGDRDAPNKAVAPPCF